MPFAGRNQQRANAQPQLPTNGNGNGEEISLSEWHADELARGLGLSDRNELIQVWRQVQQKQEKQDALLEDYQNHLMIAEFQARAPDYPNSPETDTALAKVIDDMGLGYSTDALLAAHAYAVRNGLYRPLTVEQQRAANGYETPAAHRAPAPPPMIASRAPDNTGIPQSEWTEPLDKMRARLIREQLQQGRQ